MSREDRLWLAGYTRSAEAIAECPWITERVTTLSRLYRVLYDSRTCFAEGYRAGLLSGLGD